MPTKQELIEALKVVKDPELGIDIVTLGLIYDAKYDHTEGIDVLMTLTSPFCPFGDKIVQGVEKVLKQFHAEVRVDITFEPEWQPSEEIKLMLGI